MSAAWRPVGDRRPTVALLMLGLSELSGGGGTERLFADVFDFYQHCPQQRFEPYLITDALSVERLRAIGREWADSANLLVLPTGPLSANPLARTRQLLRTMREQTFDIVHVPLVAPIYWPALWCLERTGRQRPRITITAVTSCIASKYLDYSLKDPYWIQKVCWLYRLYFQYLRIDGVYSWYQALTESLGGDVLPSRPLFRSARYCFVDGERFKPADRKEPLIVFAARMAAEKRPQMFIEGLRLLQREHPHLLAGWQVAMYGKGPLEGTVRSAVEAAGLTGRVQVTHAPTMEAVFARSRLFVSTQDYENFTSLAMQEAMAAGNAVIARDVGQTAWYVQHGRNGFLLEEDSPQGLADAIAKYLAQAHRHDELAARSRHIATVEHTVSKFVDDIEAFWAAVLERPVGG